MVRCEFILSASLVGIEKIWKTHSQLSNILCAYTQRKVSAASCFFSVAAAVDVQKNRDKSEDGSPSSCWCRFLLSEENKSNDFFLLCERACGSTRLRHQIAADQIQKRAPVESLIKLRQRLRPPNVALDLHIALHYPQQAIGPFFFFRKWLRLPNSSSNWGIAPLKRPQRGSEFA